MVLNPTTYTSNIFTRTLDIGVGLFKYIEFNLSNPNPAGHSELVFEFKVLTKAGDWVDIPELQKHVSVEANVPQVVQFDVTPYQRYSMLKVDITDTVYYAGMLHTVNTVAEVTENTRVLKWTPATFLQKDISQMYVKAFCNMPIEDMENIYLFWEASTDGITWHSLNMNAQKDITRIPPIQLYLHSEEASLPENIEDSALTPTYQAYVAYPVKATSPLDSPDVRADIYYRGTDAGSLIRSCLRARMCVVTTKDIVVNGEELKGAYVLDTELGRAEFTPVYDSKAELLHSDIYQASNSLSLRYGGALYGFGNSLFKNHIVPTYSGEATRPLSNLITLNTYENTIVSSIIPWRDYLVAFTENSTHIVTLDNDASYTKTINSDIGVPVADRLCCKATLNGVIFKSGTHVYFMYPNLYSGTDTIANLTDISEPISDYIVNYTKNSETLPFAVSSDKYYMLFMPNSNSTYCLKYEYTDKRWTFYEYPVVFYNYETISYGKLYLFGYILNANGERMHAEYYVDVDVNEIFDNVPENLPYADIVTESSEGIAADISNWGTLGRSLQLTPIDFVLDSGQKTDSRKYTKQFSESKFIVSTMHQKDAFPIKITVHIDGTPHVTVVDVNTDAAFWKTSVEDVGVLNTELNASNKDIFNTYRKMFIRYSGKGTSIRHIIEGKSLYPFKIYDMLYRFKILNTKQ